MKKMVISIALMGLALPTLALADAKIDFNSNCAKCHGGSAKTNARRALLLKVEPRRLYLPASELTKEEMITVIEKGKNRMPGFEEKLSKDQISSLADFIMSLKKK